MKLIAMVVLLSACGGSTPGASEPCPEATQATGIPLQDTPSAPMTLALTSADFTDGQPLEMRHVYSGFGCTGENISPAIAWSGAPAGTRSYAVVVHDPDAPTGVGFFHWIVVDIPATETGLARGAATALPQGARSTYTDFGGPGYGGPCPPPGSPHRYVFTVYALDVEHLEVPDGATGAFVRFAAGSHTLAYGRIVPTFARR
jgi:Raf kinase inhibitor-like YbhB/YbcL family protein